MFHLTINGRPLCEQPPGLWRARLGDCPQTCEFGHRHHAEIMLAALTFAFPGNALAVIDGRCPK